MINRFGYLVNNTFAFWSGFPNFTLFSWLGFVRFFVFLYLFWFVGALLAQLS